jgi:uncharacterized repeat protein (TIGR01451 family)
MVSALIVAAGLVFAFAPMSSVAAARQIVAARLSASPTVTKILSLAPKSLLSAIGINTATVNSTVTKIASPPDGTPVAAGQIITYTLTLANDDLPEIANSNGTIKLTDETPPNTVFHSLTILQQPTSVLTGYGQFDWECSDPGAGNAGMIACEAKQIDPPGILPLRQYFAANQTFKVEIKVKVDPSVGIGETISNKATYEFGGYPGDIVFPSRAPETSMSNTTSHQVINPTGPPVDLSVIKKSDTQNDGPVVAGATDFSGQIQYTINWYNYGPNLATGVLITDIVPANTEPVPGLTVSAPGFDCNGDIPLPGKMLQCRPKFSDPDLDELPIGSHGVIEYYVRVKSNVAEGTIIANSANITSRPIQNRPSNADLNPGNNTSLTTSTLVATKADLAISKDAPGSAIAGSEVTYTIGVTNNGPSDARDVVVTDLLGDNNLVNSPVTFVAIDTTTAPGFTCNTPSAGGSGTVTCSSALLAANASATIKIRVKVRPGFLGSSIENTACVSSATTDVSSNNNCDNAATSIQRSADVSVSKTDNPDPVVAGANLTYDIQVRNNGPSDARNVVVQDQLPAGTSFVSVSATGLLAGRCQWNGSSPGTVTCAPPGANAVLPAVSVSVVTLVVKVNPGTTGVINNTTQISTSTPDPNTDNNSDTEQTGVQTRTDITVKKTGPFQVTAGNQYAYTIVVRNNGPGDAPAGTVIMTDALDPRLTYQSSFSTGASDFLCSESAGTVTCNNDSVLPANGFATISVAFKVNDNVQANAIIPNTATVATSPPGQDPNTANNTSTTSTAGQTSADLQLTKTATPASVAAGDASSIITYTIAYRNSGPSNANAVVISDTVPANLIPVGTITAPGLNCNGATATAGAQFTCTPNAGAFGGNAAGVLPAGASGALSFQARVPASTLPGTVISNGATIASTGGSATPDPNPSNNTQDPTSTLVNTRADLSVDKSDSVSSVVAGTPVTYLIRVNNSGPSDAQNVSVTDQMDPNTTFESINSSAAPGFTCVTPAVGESGTISCSRGVVPPGATDYDISVTVRVRPGATGSVTNLATVASATNDSALGNNSDPESTPVIAVADVELISKVDQPDPVAAGRDLRYRITFRNNGPSDAQGVSVTDTIPNNTTFVAVNPPLGWSCAAPQTGGTGVVTCEPPGDALPAGAIGEISLIVRVNASVSSTIISNTATISTTTNQGANAAPDSDSEDTTVLIQPDLSIRKTGPVTVTAGNTYTYTIVVRNQGPSDAPANSVEMKDTLDSDLTFKSFNVQPGSVGGFACTNNGNAVSCKNGSVFAAGGVVTITITFDVKTGVPANKVIFNTATVETIVDGVTDPNGGNNSSTTSTAGATSADLQLTKTASPGSVIAGDATSEITYTISILNSGPSVANNVAVSDVVPANTVVTQQPVFASTGSPAITMNCSAAAPGAQFTCSVTGTSPAGSMPVGAAGVITYRVRVPANVAQNTIITNQAEIASIGTSATPDPNPSNNIQAPTSTLVNTRANLSITKSDSPDPVTAGTNLTYTLTVANAGPSDAQNVVVTDSLPANTTFVSVGSANPGFVCVNASNTVTCSAATLAANASAVITIVAFVNPNTPQGTVLSNSATVSSTTTDPAPGNNATGPITTTVNAVADVELVSKTDTPDPVAAGREIRYRITFRNNGPSDAQNVSVSDTVPANTTFVSVTPPLGWSCTAPQTGGTGAVSCTPPSGVLPAGAIGDITMVVRVNNSVANTTISNTATISTSTNQGGATSNDSKTETTTVLINPDLSIRKSGPATVTAGNTYTYTIIVRNDGPSDAPATSVEMADTLDPDLTFSNVNIQPGSLGGFTCTNNGNAVSCQNGSVFPVGGVVTFTITFAVKPGVPQNKIIFNTATVATVTNGVTDPNTGNNSSTTSTAGQTSADLQLAKTSSPTSVIAGSAAPADEITYTISILNSGPSVANNVVVSDVVPSNTVVTAQPAFVSTGAPAITVNCSAAAAGAQFTCVVTGTSPAGSMPVGAQGTITYKVRVPANIAQNTIVTNQAEIASVGGNATPDPNPSNNIQAPTSTLVNTRADLSITKSDSPDPVTAGSNLTYTLTVSNAGPSDTQNVVVTDAVPANTTYVSVASADPGFVCLNSNNTITCNKATLAAGDSTTITIVVKVNANVASGTVLSNSATVSSTTTDPSASNNSSGPITTTVNTNAVFTITKSDNPDPVVAGTNLSYRVSLTNNGPSDAQSVVLTDTLPNTPAGAVSFISVKGTGVFAAAGACAHSSGVITCVATPGGVMPAGATAHVDIVVKVSASVPATTVLTNIAVVTSPTSAQTAAERTDTETTTVRHQSDLALVKDAPSEVIAGSRMDYKLTITNGGPSDVLGEANPGSITVVDDLPPGVIPVDLQGQPLSGSNVPIALSGPGGFTCSYDSGANSVTCRNAAGAAGNFAVGSVATITFKVKTASNFPDGFNVVNCARITLPVVTSDPATAIETDPNGGNNESCDATVVRTSADLGVSKTAAPVNPVPGSNPPAVRAGENIRYTVVFGNAGPSDAVNVRVTDNVPGNTSIVTTFPLSVTGTGGVKLVCNYDANTNVITCAPSGNTGLTPSAPEGVLPAGFQGTLIYDVRVNPSVSGGAIIANAANITSAASGTAPGTPDPNPGNNQSQTTSTPVVSASQLAITKSIQSATYAQTPPAPAGAVVPGTFLTYRITVRNNGPSDVSNLRVIDQLPSTLESSVNRYTGVKYISVQQSGGFGTTFTCAPPTGVNPDRNPNGNGGQLQCTAPLMSATAPNNEATIDIIVFIDPATKVDLVNNASVNATTNNFNQPISSSTTVATSVGPTSDLAVTKTHAPDPVVAGAEFVYTVTLTNNGPSTAQMVELVDNLPPYQSIVSAQVIANPDQNGAPAFTCAPSTVAGTPPHAQLTCTADELPPNKKQDGTVNPAGTVTFKIRVLQDPFTPQPTPISYQNCVSATSMSFDPVTGNSINVCDTVNVIFLADLAITKSDDPDPVIAGQTLTYSIEATNGGASAALNMKITDSLPSGTVFISAAASAGATLTTPAVGANGAVTATWAGLTGPGASRTLTIVVRVCPDFQQIRNLTDNQMCQPNLTNTATASSDTPDPNQGNNSASAETTVQAESNLSISKLGPAQAIYSTTGSDSIITYTINFANAGPSNASGVKVVDVLPKGFEVVGTPTSTVSGTTFSVTTTEGVQTVTAHVGALGAANQCSATPRPTSGVITIRAKVPIKHPTITVTNTATISTTNCLEDPDLANNTASASTRVEPPPINPGIPFPALAEVSDQKEGSILFYPIYTSDAASPNIENARINITNTSSTEKVCVHLYAVDGSSCAVLDAFLCLTPNQTSTFLASDFDPGAAGYVVAVAVDCETGLPRAFNELIGDEYVKFSSGHAANFGAEAIAAVTMFPGGVNPNVTTTRLRFNGTHYNRLPRVLAVDNIPSPADGNSTMLIINSVGGDFTSGGDSVGGFTGLLFDDQEQSFSFTSSGGCQFRTILSNSFPRTFTPFSRVIPAGRTGWMKFWTTSDSAILGSVINYNPSPNANSSAFNQGHNLHKLTLTDAAEITVPVFIPTCSF